MAEPISPTALVIDDDVTGRLFLRGLLRRAGYVVEAVSSGEEALLHFEPGKFDVVFMDLLMPGMDGIETTKRLKALSGEVFTPVIFVTGAGDEQSLTQAIDSGGDDFLTKPVTANVLLAKLRAMERIRKVHARTRALYARVIEDQEMAHEVFDRAVSARAYLSPALRSKLVPAEVFSGDLLLSAKSPEGRLHILVGDFTGHGLAAALGAMPVAEAFHSMVSKGFAPDLMLQQLNQRVCDALPRGHFLAAAAVSVDAALTTLTVANCGLPSLLLCGQAGIRERIASDSFSLGIDRDASFDNAFRSFPICRGERLVIASDGVSEACNDHREPFGEARLEALIAGMDENRREAPAAVFEALDLFRGGTPFADDASVIEICLTQALLGDATGTTPEVMPGLEFA
jgi:CheY-like chemotaxis protein